MKILIATGLYPPEIGGPATYTRMLEEKFPALGTEVTVAPYGWVRRYPKLVRHLAFTWKLIREVKDCDILYALDPVSVGLPACLAAFVRRKPLVLRVAGDYAWEQGQQRFGVKILLDEFVRGNSLHPFVWLMRKVQKGVARHARMVIVPSKYMKGVVTQWGIEEVKIKVVYSALFPLEVREDVASIRKMFEYKGTVIVTAGRLVPWKGIQTLISLVPKLKETLGAVTLIIIGDGPLESKLKEHAETTAVSDSVRFIGRLPKTSLGAAIKGADLFVLNTAYEGLSHQLLEVMALGVPVVTTDVGGNPELIEDGQSGLLVPFNDEEKLHEAMSRMISETKLRERCVTNATERVKAFSEDDLMNQLNQYLIEVLS